MRNNEKFVVVLVTAPDPKSARRLAQAALRARLAACANLVPKIESHYWWQGKLETSSETLMIFKTTVARAAALEKLIIKEHPYDTPEFIVLPIAQGSRAYLNWLQQEVGSSQK